MKKILYTLCLCAFISTGYAQEKKYTGEDIRFVNENGREGTGWINPGKYTIYMGNQKYGYYISEQAKATQVSSFDTKKYDKKKTNNKAVHVSNFGGKIFTNANFEIGKFRVNGAQCEFTFFEPYKVIYIKGVQWKKMAEQLIDEGYLKP